MPNTSTNHPSVMQSQVYRSARRLFWVLPASVLVVYWLRVLGAMLDEIHPPHLEKPLQQHQEETKLPHKRRTAIPLKELVQSADADQHPQNCGAGMVWVRDTLLDPALLFQGNRKIPRLVHISSKSRCNAKLFADNIDTWRLKDHSLVLHDDPAVERLLLAASEWPEFPMLQQMLTCLPAKGAVMTDVWRILALWEYGGIYADMDASPVPGKFNETTITSEDDAFFVVEVLGTPSQWFMAVSPRHPIMFLTMQRIIINVMKILDLGDFPFVFTTGPGAVAEGFRDFIGYFQAQFKAGHYPAYMGLQETFQQQGSHGNERPRSIRLVGDRANESEFITRVIPAVKNSNVKHQVYQQTNMTHLTYMGLREKKQNVSCLARLYNHAKIKEPPLVVYA